MGVATGLAEASASLEMERAKAGERRQQLVTAYLALSVVLSTGYAFFFFTRAEPLHLWLGLVSLITAVAQVVGIVLVSHGHVTAAGILSQAAPIFPVIVYSSATSATAGFSSLLFIGALGVVVTVPDEAARARFALIFALVLAVVAVQVFFTPERAWAPITATETLRLFTISRTIMTVALFVLALVLTREARLAKELADQALRVAHLAAETDPLTGLANRRPVWAKLGRLEAENEPFSVAIADLDNFKKLNDAYGHDCGDETLIHIAELLEANMREGDMVARWGGEEFVIVLPNTSLEEALRVGDRLRAIIANSLPACQRAPHAVTVSLGVADSVEGSRPEDALQRADGALYQAKVRGRNIVVAATP